MGRLAPLLALALAACATPNAPSQQADLARRTTSAVEGYDMVDRYIVRRSAGLPCPASGAGWLVTPLFDTDLEGYLPPLLERYCVFERNGAEGDAVPHAAGQAEPDLLAMAPLGVADPMDVHRNTLERIRPLPLMASRPPHRIRNSRTQPAWLSILDSSPTALPSEDPWQGAGFDDHGQLVATLAATTVCPSDAPGQPCHAGVSTQLALGYTYAGGEATWSAGGGSMGSVADLATAVHLATKDWRNASKPGPLVLNLSLGSHPDAGGASVGTTPAFGALYDALRMAACQGAVIVAAVGNLDTPVGAGNRSGPLVPAAWETVAAPTRAECQQLMGAWYDGLDPLGSEGYTPLVYAAGAVDVLSQPLITQRPGAMPRLAAAGAHVAGADPNTGATTSAFSGTSAASVVVAGAAAVLRTYMPTANAHTVMRVLYESASTQVAPTADVCLPGSGCGPTVEVRVCDAVAYACDKGLATCPSWFSQTSCDTEYGTPAVLQPPADTRIDVSVRGNVRDVCSDGSRVIYDFANPDSNCPFAELYAATSLPSTLPQPGGHECPWCPAYPDDDQVELETDVDLTSMGNVTIVVRRTGGDVHYPIDDQVSTNSQTVQLPAGSLAQSTVDGDLVGVVLSYTTPFGLFIAEPLYLVQ